MKTKQEIEQLAEQYLWGKIFLTKKDKYQTEIAYMTGYTQCQKDIADKRYTKEDLENAFNSGKGYGVPDNIKDFNSFINSLNKQD